MRICGWILTLGGLFMTSHFARWGIAYYGNMQAPESRQRFWIMMVVSPAIALVGVAFLLSARFEKQRSRRETQQQDGNVE